MARAAGAAGRRWPPCAAARGRQAGLALALLLPAALVVFGVVLYPAGRALVISFYDVNSPFPGTYPFRGLANYTDILGSERFWTAVGHTLYFTVGLDRRRAGARASVSPCCSTRRCGCGGCSGRS